MEGLLDDVGIVLIGRNEGDRLLACMASLGHLVSRTVYVDSGSTDGSVAAARALGAHVILLDTEMPFTAARARNAGFAALMAIAPTLSFVQFVDGDCRVVDRWIETARAFLLANETVAIVCGRRREIFPDVSVYNRICDGEWNTPVGEALACGGDCLIRCDAFRQVNGYTPDLIAGEEPEMCLRMREVGLSVWRIDEEMTQHDADITRFSQWWRRSVRAGHAYAEVAARHRLSPKRIWARNVQRAVFWGGALPLAAIAAAVFLHAGFLAIFLAYPLQIMRFALKSGASQGGRWSEAFFLVIGKFAEMQGIATYYINRVARRQQALIEYK